MATRGRDWTVCSQPVIDLLRFVVAPPLLLRLLEVATRLISRMTRVSRCATAIGLALVWLTAPHSALAQGASQAKADSTAAIAGATLTTASAQTTGQTAPPAKPLPIDLDCVKRQAEKQPAVKLDEQQLRFYLLVQQQWTPKFVDFVGGYDLQNGPTKGGAAMTHQEFMNMVTPKELNELFGATSASSFAVFQSAVMNAAGQSLIKKAIQDIRQAHDEHEVQAIRERIDQELAALDVKDK